jgi:hypothetical protein
MTSKHPTSHPKKHVSPAPGVHVDGNTMPEGEQPRSQVVIARGPHDDPDKGIYEGDAQIVEAHKPEKRAADQPAAMAEAFVEGTLPTKDRRGAAAKEG